MVRPSRAHGSLAGGIGRAADAVVGATTDPPAVPRLPLYPRGARLRTVRSYEMSGSSRCLIAAAVACIVLGAIFRVWGLDRSVFTTDETVGAYHVAGYVTAEMRALFAGQRGVRASELRAIYTPNPHRSSRDVVTGLAREDALHAPLFYVVERGWLELAGTSIAARRALAAIFGLLGIAAAGWLCGLATRSRPGGWIGAALFALSPFQVVYAQEMLEYSLFATLTCATSALLLLVLRAPRRATVCAYALGLAAGLYTSVLFPLVIAAHMTVVVALRAPRPVLVRAFAAAALAFAAWVPWARAILALHGAAASVSWTKTPWSPFALAAKWLFNASTAFFDGTYGDARWAPLTALVLVAIGCAFAGLHKGSREVRAIVWALLAWCFGAPALADIVFGGHSSTVARYVAPAFCALVVMTAAWATNAWEKRGQRRSFVPASVAFALCAAGALSLGLRAQHAAWWDNGRDAAVPAIAAAIDAAHLPVLVTDGNWALAIDLANYTRDDIAFIVVPAARVEPLALRLGRVLVVTTSSTSGAQIRNERALTSRLVSVAPGATPSVALFRRHLVGAPAAAPDASVDDALAALFRVAPAATTANRGISSRT